MRTLVYKRTHSGDPDPMTGVFGNHGCMGQVRGWGFDAVIGVGGIGTEPQSQGIAGKLTWVGVWPHRTGNPRRPKVTFDHFLYYGEKGKMLSDLAPLLAKRLYERNTRVIMDSLSDEELREVEMILKLARNAPPSGQLTRITRLISRNRGCKRRPSPCGGAS